MLFPSFVNVRRIINVVSVSNSLFCNSYNDNAIATYYNGKYYLACKLTFPDNDIVGCESGEFQNIVLIELDIRTGELNLLRGYDIINIQTLNNRIETKMIICIKDNVVARLGELTSDGEVFGVPTYKVWRSPKTNFGEPVRYKLVKC